MITFREWLNEKELNEAIRIDGSLENLTQHKNTVILTF